MNPGNYDTIVIGAGIAGTSAAYFLQQKGQKVLILDKRGIGGGGSGAAGAFVSPKIGKGSPLQTLTNEAFSFAKAFYTEHFPDFYLQTGVVRIPKDDADAAKFPEYEAHNRNRYEKLSPETLKSMGIHTPYESFYFEEAGICDAPALCEALIEKIAFLDLEVKDLHYLPERHLWQVDDFQANNVILATGFESGLVDMRYMGVRATWGTRGDFSTRYRLDVSMHQSMSVSANIDGVIKLGATHEKSVKTPIECEESQALSLRDKASELVDVSDFELIETFCGMRAGSRDYFPLLGKVIDTNYMLENYPAITRGAKPPLKYLEHLFVCNGLGGRGFVFGPMMGKMLADYMIDDRPIDPRVDADRLFLKWCRRSGDALLSKI